MPHTLLACPQCGLENTYPDSDQFACDCAHEWSQQATASADDTMNGGSVHVAEV